MARPGATSTAYARTPLAGYHYASRYDSCKEGVAYVQVTFQDCVNELVGKSEEAKRELQRWERRHERYSDQRDKELRLEFNRTVKLTVHKRLFEVTTREIEQASQGGHALGDLDRDQDSLREVEDFDTPFAQEYFFHALLEESGYVPTFKEFWEEINGRYREYYIDRLEVALASTRYTTGQKMRAIKWRLGKTYYSCLRELYVLAALRECYQLTLKYHIFAGLVLKYDGWLGEKVLQLKVPNKYEERKPRPVGRLMAIPVEIEHQGFGRWWKPSPGQIEKVARWFRES